MIKAIAMLCDKLIIVVGIGVDDGRTKGNSAFRFSIGCPIAFRSVAVALRSAAIGIAHIVKCWEG